MSVEKGKRLDSLDALRGLTMFWITGGATLVSALALLVTGDKNAWLCQQMTHVPWAGLHIYDLIFPTFLFITGVTFPFSTAKRLERGDSKAAIAWNILRRALVLIALGAVYEEIQKLDWAHFRVWSVIGRIGLVWGVAALMTLCCRLRTCVAVALVILVGWWLFYRWVPAPGGEWGVNYLFNPKDAFARWFDTQYLTTAHRGEGGLTSIAMLPTAFLGIWAGQYLRLAKDGLTPGLKTLTMLGAALAMIALGCLWAWPSWGCPVIKNCWSGSFVLVAGGISLALLAIFYWLIDVKGWKAWSFYFRVIGMNAIAIYLSVKFFPLRPTGRMFLGALVTVSNSPAWFEVVSSFGQLAVGWLILYFCYRKKIFFKV